MHGHQSYSSGSGNGDRSSSTLAALNSHLLGRGDARATCLVLRIERDGTATLTNAGHLPPYLNGKPMGIEGSLPLSMVQQFECSMHRLLRLSDGGAEATDPNDQLFGFERTLELVRTQHSAGRIADAAQDFGQKDYFSVILVAKVPIAKPTLA